MPISPQFLLIEMLLCQQSCEILKSPSFQRLFDWVSTMCQVPSEQDEAPSRRLNSTEVTDSEQDKMLSRWKMWYSKSRCGAEEGGFIMCLEGGPWQIQSLWRQVVRKITGSCHVTCGPGKPNRKLVSQGRCGWALITPSAKDHSFFLSSSF